VERNVRRWEKTTRSERGMSSSTAGVSRRENCSFREARRNAMTATTTNPEKELAHRTSGGIDVSLYWNKRTNRITVEVYDSQSGETFAFEVDGRSALDAYRHPFAYAAPEKGDNVGAASGRMAA
jgi:hypothetical protein